MGDLEEKHQNDEEDLSSKSSDKESDAELNYPKVEFPKEKKSVQKEYMKIGDNTMEHILFHKQDSMYQKITSMKKLADATTMINNSAFHSINSQNQYDSLKKYNISMTANTDAKQTIIGNGTGPVPSTIVDSVRLLEKDRPNHTISNTKDIWSRQSTKSGM